MIRPNHQFSLPLGAFSGRLWCRGGRFLREPQLTQPRGLFFPRGDLGVDDLHGRVMCVLSLLLTAEFGLGEKAILGGDHAMTPLLTS